MSIVLVGSTSGSVTLQEPAIAGSTVVNLPSVSMNIGQGGGEIATNTAVGASALAANTTGADNVAVGYQALKANTTGVENTAVGDGALTTNTTGGFNTAHGLYALRLNTTGLNNSALGHGSLQSNTTASNNTAVGYQAGYANTTGAYNTIFGSGAGKAITTTSNSTIIGGAAGELATGASNTFVGTFSGGYITSGAKNTILGTYSGNQGGLDIRTASNYIVLSDGDGNPRGIFDGSGYFMVGTTSAGGQGGLTVYPNGSGTSAQMSFKKAADGVQNGAIVFFAGSTQVGSITYINNSTSFNTSSDYRLKENIAPMTGALAVVQQLNPCTYKWKSDGSNGQGFIAHELAEVVPDCVTGEKDAVDAEGNPQYQGIDTSFLVATLTAAIQELKAEFDAYKASHP